jgi:hypothetical protein
MRFRSAAFGLLFVACYSSGEGKSPPLDRIYFPVGLAIDRAKEKLYVANSDFDLQYNAGTIQAFDLERIRSLIPHECETDADCTGLDHKLCDSKSTNKHIATFFCVEKLGDEPCGALGAQTPAERSFMPGRCKYADLTSPAGDSKKPLLVDSVAIGAFATDLQFHTYHDREKGKDIERMFVPVRGEASLHWLDFDSEGKMDCGQKNSPSQMCDRFHRVGTDPDVNSRNERMPTEPFGMAINDEGDALVLTHQTSGRVSLFSQDLAHLSDGPVLNFIQTDLPTQVLGVANVPSPQIVRDAREAWIGGDRASAPDPYPPGFVVTYSNAAQIDLLRYYADNSSEPSRPFLQLAASVAISANSVGTDSRGIVFDDSERKTCERDCAAIADARQSCLTNCAAMPIPVYVSNRSPSSLIIGTTTQDTSFSPNRDVPRFIDTVPLAVSGQSRVFVNQIIGNDGTPETRVFVVSFDSQKITIYDPNRRRIDTTVSTGRGPHALTFDVAPADEAKGTPARAHAFVGHFTDSYIGVIELDRRKKFTYGTVVLSLGPATAPRASK